MPRNSIIRAALLATLVVGSAGAYAADPSMDSVYQAAEHGRMSEALTMMDQVLRDHPKSAKAHYVEAELMAKQGRLAEARSQLAKAETLAPGLPFVKPESVKALVARLSGGSALVGGSHRPSARYPSPWGLLLTLAGLLGVVLIVVRLMARRSGAPMIGAGQYGPASPMQPYGPGGFGPMAPRAGGMGSGILGGLATGAAVGAGMVAGEELMHHFLDGNAGGSAGAPITSADPFISSPDDMGGQDFGISDGSWDDGSSSGGDDWS